MFLQNNNKRVNTKAGCRYFSLQLEPAQERVQLPVLQQRTERPMAAWQTRSRRCHQSPRLLRPQTAQLLAIHPRQTARLRGWDRAACGSDGADLPPLITPPSLCSSHDSCSTSWNLSELVSRYTPVSLCAALNAWRWKSQVIMWLSGFLNMELVSENSRKGWKSEAGSCWSSTREVVKEMKASRYRNPRRAGDQTSNQTKFTKKTSS